MTRRRARGAYRTASDERGVVLLVVLATALLVTLLVSALVLSTMSETTIARHQRDGAQALLLAEAGAYRALGELRHHLTLHLDAGIGQAGREEILAACETDQGWQLVARYAGAGPSSEWAEDPATGEAVLHVTGGEPLVVLDRDGHEVGRFTASVRVRSVLASDRGVCERGDATTTERYDMWLSYEIQATGLVRNARRAVRLTNPEDSSVPLRIERASIARWALLVLDRSETWLTDSTVIEGPAHANGVWWIWGQPTFRGQVSSAVETVRFGNCGSPLELAAADNPGAGSCGGDRPRYLVGELRRGAPQVALPAETPSPARAALGLDPAGADPTEHEIRLAAPDQLKAGQPVREDVYVPNDSRTRRHPQTQLPAGIYIKGRVQTLALLVEEGRQVIIVQQGDRGSGDAKGKPKLVQTKVVIDPEQGTTVVERAGSTRTYTGTGNGVIYADGPIESLFGIVHRNVRLTIAARATITLTDHVVYQSPPGRGSDAANLLGLYSLKGDVQVDGARAPRDLHVDAVILAPEGKFWVKEFNALPDRGTLSVLGGVVQAKLGEFGAFDPARDTRLGYSRVVRFDRRLLHQMPPFFPLSSRYAAPRPRPDPLYRKPRWEEIPVP